jgi:hypothetical protein
MEQEKLSKIYDEFVSENKWETKNWKLVLTIGGMKFRSKNQNSKGKEDQITLTLDTEENGY